MAKKKIVSTNNVARRALEAFVRENTVEVVSDLVVEMSNRIDAHDQLVKWITKNYKVDAFFDFIVGLGFLGLIAFIQNNNDKRNEELSKSINNLSIQLVKMKTEIAALKAQKCAEEQLNPELKDIIPSR